jgi:hypothetical protein
MHDVPTGRRRTLNGWKEIAAYVGKSVRSVQRWEDTLGLPVRRIRTPDGQIVYAEADEIDGWRRKLDTTPEPEPEDPLDPESLPEPKVEAAVAAATEVPAMSARYSARVLAAITVLMLTIGVAFGAWVARPSPIAVDFAIVGRTLEGLSAKGAVMWTYTFDREVSLPYGTGTPPLVDIDNDGALELIVPIRFAALGIKAPMSDAVYSFTRRGTVEWSYQPDLKFTYPAGVTTGPWEMRDIAISDTTPRRIWAAFHHHTGGTSFVMEIAPDGKATLRYFQPGRIYSVARWVTPSGAFLAIGGGSIEHHLPALVLLPENDPPAVFPNEDPSRTTCAECPGHVPRRLYLFPRLEMSIASHDLNPFVSNLQVIGPNLKLAITQGVGSTQAVLNPDFSLASVTFTQNYWAAHKELEQKNRLDHAAESCPERGATQVIREWALATGWREMAMTPSGLRAPAPPPEKNTFRNFVRQTK